MRCTPHSSMRARLASFSFGRPRQNVSPEGLRPRAVHHAPRNARFNAACSSTTMSGGRLELLLGEAAAMSASEEGWSWKRSTTIDVLW